MDDLTQPASVLIATACGLALLHGNRAGGAFHREALEALFGTLAVDEYAFVIALPDAWRPVLQSAPEPRGARWAYRVELGVDIAWFRAQGPCREGVSDGYTFRRYDGALAGLGREGGVRGPPRGARGGREDRQKASFDVPIQRRVSHARPAP